MGVRGLSALVLTHPQRDHVGGAATSFGSFASVPSSTPGLRRPAPSARRPSRLRANAAYRFASCEPGRSSRQAGSSCARSGRPIPVLPPEDPNLNALVLVATYGETDVLLTADAESDVTAGLPLGGIEVLKVAHHGSADPGLDDELRVLRPRIAVISCGRNNDYGHPRAETLAALAGSPGLAVYRTDTDGRVVIESDGRQLRVRTHG